MKSYNSILKLACLTVLAPVIVWKFAIGSTFSLYLEKQEAESITQNTPESPQEVKHEPAFTSSDPLLSNGRFLQMFADTFATEKVRVISYTPERIDSEDIYKLYCGKLVLSGKYIELVKVVSAIEKATLPLKIVSACFEYDVRQRDAPEEILLRLLVEQIEH